MEEQGPFDRILQADPLRNPDRAATLIVIVGIVLGLLLMALVVWPFSVFDHGSKKVDIWSAIASPKDQAPAPPDGFEPVSAFYELKSQPPLTQPSGLTFPLSVSVSEGEHLVGFTNEGDRWRRLGDAELAKGDKYAVVEVLALPANIAVFRSVERARVVLGELPAGVQPDAQALQTISTLNPAGFHPQPDGSIDGQVTLPAGLTVDIAPTVGATSEADVQAVNGILSSPELRGQHVAAIVALAQTNNYAGIDLDYRSFDAELRDEFVSFVQDLSTALRTNGKTLTITLPAPVRNGDTWDTQGFDWEKLAPLTTYVKIVFEADQGVYFQRMEDALGYLTPRVGASKLLLAISPLSHERGPDGIGTLTLTEALTLASTPATDAAGPFAPGSTVEAHGANLTAQAQTTPLFWDDTAHAVVFHYPGPGGDHIVWLTNAFSEAFKLDLARRYQLGGVVVQDVSSDHQDSNIWPAVALYVQTGAVGLAKPNGDLLQPRWTASGGTLQNAAGPAVTWQAPGRAGSYKLTLIVSDGIRRVGQELALTVAGATP